jgi:PAS domain S-box-containing protein
MEIERETAAASMLERPLALSDYLRGATHAAERLSTQLDLDHLLDTVAESLIEDFRAIGAEVWLRDAERKSLVLRAKAGKPTRPSECSSVPLSSKDPIAVVAQSRVPFLRSGQAPRGDPKLEGSWPGREYAAAILPLSVGGKLLGVFGCSFDTLERERIEALLAFAALVATSINDVMLFQREKAFRAEAERAFKRERAARAHAERAFQREQAARALAERQRDELEAARITLRSIGDAVITTDTKRSVEFMNPVAEALTGWTLAEARHRPLREIFRVADELTREPLDGPDDRVLRQGRVVALASQAILLGRDGREAMIDGTGAPIRSECGELKGVVLVFRDVTSEKRAEHRRRFIAEASAHLSASLDYTTALSSLARLAVAGLADWCTIDLIEEDGGIRSLATAHADHALVGLVEKLRRSWPPRLEDRYGVGNVLHTGESALIAQISDAQLASWARGREHLRILQRLKPASIIVTALIARGRTLGAIQLVSCDARRRYDSDDLAMAEDLARRAGQAIDNARLFLRAQEAARAREEFLSIASHELKTPLTSLQLQVQSLLRAAAGGTPVTAEKSKAKLESAHRQMDRLSGLINNLLDVSRITEGRLQLEPEPLDLSTAVREVAERLGEQRAQTGCELQIEAPPGATGLWDKLRIEQVVTNLLSNAIKYGAGKPVRVSVRAEAATAILTVADRGIGIAPADVERIFARFERAVSARHYGGLGVGLFIVKRALEAMGGSIEVISAPGEGATFRVKLPRAQPTIAAKVA